VARYAGGSMYGLMVTAASCHELRSFTFTAVR
jgi:hypothetical protein